MSNDRVTKQLSSIANHIYPKRIPKIKFGPVKDDLGFTLSERVALRQAWNLIRPFERRYGQEVFYRNGVDLNLKALHTHAVKFIHFFGLLIEVEDPVVFQQMITDNNLTHSRCKVGSAYIGDLAQALVNLVLKVSHKVRCPSLESGFRKIVEKFHGYQDLQAMKNPGKLPEQDEN
ncbi:uncharacterized protein LOC128252558 isoform X2 [Drosophila gunungcola]|uniref:uncharacterized protein LOC128252558 isoform X2 n=1 Tax=Drosophila gunungcola TaxID=103775 RepID=UPI0022E75339|nr:uncharacterized protein LOC128252558 isoform X2 [Drosophila gunungcola]